MWCNFTRGRQIDLSLVPKHICLFLNPHFVYSKGIASDNYKDVYKGMRNYFAVYFMEIYFLENSNNDMN